MEVLLATAATVEGAKQRLTQLASTLQYTVTRLPALCFFIE
jgi:hypothetical protein